MENNTVRTHAIDMDSLGRESSNVSLGDETISLSVEDLNLYYEGRKQALNNINRYPAISYPLLRANG